MSTVFSQVFTPTKGPKEGSYNLPIDFKTRVKVVDTNKAYQDFMNDMRYSVTRVGLAHAGDNYLIVSTNEKVYIFDIPVLKKPLSNQDWFKIGADFLRKPAITKVVWNTTEEVEAWGKAVSVLKKYLQEMVEQNQVCDMKQLLTGQQELFNCPTGSINDAVVHFLGNKPIDDEPAKSDWAKKPITDAQKIYSGIISHSLLKVIDGMKKAAKEKGAEVQLPM